MFALSLEQISVTRADRVLVSGLTLSVGPGELLHLRGPNGIGKTSLLEILAGLRHPESGRVLRADGLDWHWLGHRNGFNSHLSALENLQFWCGVNARDSRAVAAALTQVGITGRVQRRPARTLSAGQKRRSALARLVLAQRRLWLLDEPLDGLDSDGLQLFETLMRTHLAAGGSAVMTSHQSLPTGIPGVRDWVLGT